MKSRLPYFLVVFTALLAPAAHAQFGSGIVYDPTQSAHAIQQLSQGEQELQKWAQELQKWEQHLQKEEQIYTTAYQTMNQVIAAYNLAYQMSRMPQNLAARYKSDFSQWTRLSNSSSSGSNTSGITSAWRSMGARSMPLRLRDIQTMSNPWLQFLMLIIPQRMSWHSRYLWKRSRMRRASWRTCVTRWGPRRIHGNANIWKCWFIKWKNSTSDISP